MICVSDLQSTLCALANTQPEKDFPNSSLGILFKNYGKEYYLLHNTTDAHIYLDMWIEPNVTEKKIMQ